jgi:hypothetical protein
MRAFAPRLALVPLAALALAACQEEPVDLEPAAEDQSGGELIMEPVDPNAVPVEVPETPMTNVPVEDAEAAPEAE